MEVVVSKFVRMFLQVKMENCYQHTKCSKSIHFPATNSLSTTQNKEAWNLETIPKDSLSNLHNSFIKIIINQILIYGQVQVSSQHSLFFKKNFERRLVFFLLNQSSINLNHNSNASLIDNYNQTHSRQLIKWQNTQIYFLISTHCCFQQYKDKF